MEHRTTLKFLRLFSLLNYIVSCIGSSTTLLFFSGISSLVLSFSYFFIGIFSLTLYLDFSNAERLNHRKEEHNKGCNHAK